MKVLEWIINYIKKDFIYISGPMSGYTQLNKPLFNRMEKRLKRNGYKVINPATFGNGSWAQCLTRDLILLLLFCNKMAMLPRWQKSKGANLEYHVAYRLGMTIKKINYWLQRRVK